MPHNVRSEGTMKVGQIGMRKLPVPPPIFQSRSENFIHMGHVSFSCTLSSVFFQWTMEVGQLWMHNLLFFLNHCSRSGDM